MADDKTQIMGDYAANTDPRFVITPRKGLSGLGDDVAFAAGCQSTHCANYSSHSIKVAVTSADLVIVCLGTGKVLRFSLTSHILIVICNRCNLSHHSLSVTWTSQPSKTTLQETKYFCEEFLKMYISSI